MLNVVKTKINMDVGLKNKIVIICSFRNTKPIIHTGYLVSIEYTNICYVEPHRIIIDDITYLAFNYGINIYIENLT